MREAEANKLMLTPQYLDLKFSEAIANNTKIFFGNKVWSILFFFFCYHFVFFHANCCSCIDN